MFHASPGIHHDPPPPGPGGPPPGRGPGHRTAPSLLVPCTGLRPQDGQTPWCQTPELVLAWSPARLPNVLRAEARRGLKNVQSCGGGVRLTAALLSVHACAQALGSVTAAAPRRRGPSRLNSRLCVQSLSAFTFAAVRHSATRLPLRRVWVLCRSFVMEMVVNDDKGAGLFFTPFRCHPASPATSPTHLASQINSAWGQGRKPDQLPPHAAQRLRPGTPQPAGRSGWVAGRPGTQAPSICPRLSSPITASENDLGVAWAPKLLPFSEA